MRLLTPFFVILAIGTDDIVVKAVVSNVFNVLAKKELPPSKFSAEDEKVEENGARKESLTLVLTISLDPTDYAWLRPAHAHAVGCKLFDLASDPYVACANL